MGSLQPEIDIDDVLSRLTIEEKISLLAGKDWWRTPAISRPDVFVPHIKMTDGPNGARGESYVSGIRAACFPCSTNMGATFDEQLLFKVGQEIAKEAISKSANVLLAPTLNMIRSPLGGRNYETYSEDPTVLGVLAAAFVNGCQSMGIAATPKHFAANDAENQRKTLSAEIDEQTLRELYLLPFQLVMKYSRPLCFMTPYNRVNGTYVADSDRLIQQVLREEWGFDGLVMSDWMGTYSTEQSLIAGVDIEMPGVTKWRGKLLQIAVKEGRASSAVVEKSARRVLELAQRLGRWGNPVEEPEQEAENPVRDRLIRDGAADGMVVLKNESATLPIHQGARLAIIGHLALTASLGGGGSARVEALHTVSPLQGFQDLGFDCNAHSGVPVFGAVPHAHPAIVSRTAAPVSTMTDRTPVKLEWFNGPMIGQRLAHEEMIGRAEYMIKEAWPSFLEVDYCTRITFDVTPRSTGDHVLSVVTTGHSICYIDGEKVFDRIQETDLKPESFYFFKAKLERRFTHPMKAGQRYTLVLENWATEPVLLNHPPLRKKMYQGAALRFFENVDITRAILEATEVAKHADYAIVCVGNTNEIESEGYDRDTMDLPGEQYALLDAIAASNPRTVVVNFSGAPVSLNPFITKVPAFLQAWFPGQECGHSVAHILTGKINPSGCLPFSWPVKIEDNPSYGNFPAGPDDILRYAERLDVGYRHYDRADRPTAIYPFGFGLSYTTFSVSDATVSDNTLLTDHCDKISVSCTVRNTGSRFGKLVVQFYVQYPKTNIGWERPVKELKAFTKVALKIGESKTASVQLDKYAVSLYDAQRNCWCAVAGRYVVLVGTSSVDIAQKVEFDVLRHFEWTGI